MLRFSHYTSSIYSIHPTYLQITTFSTPSKSLNRNFPIMENSRSYVGVRWFTVAVMVLLLSTEYLQLIEAQPRCDPVELSWCLQAIVSNMPPSAACCRRLKRQEPCLCQEMTDPTFGGYLKLPGAKRVARACGVTFPTCR
ncbi:hypothetical protein L1887_35963 [Cichorium endivia]|nr:hypothetical protein L1887_35963 [Cichorium endivia]